MTDIDREKACKLVDALRGGLQVGACGYPGAYLLDCKAVGKVEKLLASIRSEAVKAERERCADMAVDWVKCNQGPDGYLIGFPASLRAAILSDDKESTNG